ncbi:MAG: glycosyltransferase family 4 protein [Cyanobacteria bacterium J06627_15]
MLASSLKLLFLSTPVGPLGSGLGGGVELTLVNLSQALIARGHQVAIAAPEGSRLPHNQAEIIPIAGAWQPTAHTQTRNTPIALPANSVLANLWDHARRDQHQYDLLVNFAYDWLPFYLTPFFHQPVAHFVTMGSLNQAMDAAITTVAEQFPGRLGAYTQSQVATFPETNGWQVLGSAVDLTQYHFCGQPDDSLVWLGRISPEKGLEDAVAAAQASGCPLKILGKLEDPDYWQRIQAQYPDAPIEYLGFVGTQQLQAIVRRCRALIMTPRWVEAFGNVAIEALACGVPVIAYRRGGPAEIIQPGKTGWLVAPDSIEALTAAIAQIDQLDRQVCRQWAETHYSLPALGQRFEAWFRRIIPEE